MVEKNPKTEFFLKLKVEDDVMTDDGTISSGCKAHGQSLGEDIQLLKNIWNHHPRAMLTKHSSELNRHAIFHIEKGQR